MRLLAPATVDPSLSFTPHCLTTFRHHLHEGERFADASLIDLFDSYPRDSIEVMTMGAKLADGEWRRGDLGALRGRDVLEAITRGHLWVNIKHVHENDARLAALVDESYAQIAEAIREPVPRWKAATLLVSSPSAFVYYHADAVPNFLWHIRGRKRVWVYPAHDERYCPAPLVEDICSGHAPEGLPYEPLFDDGASRLDLEPGIAASWPLHAPHRVDNLEGLNVSLSTEHVTPGSRRSLHVMRGNRVLRRKFGLAPKSMRPDGFGASFKAGLGTFEHAVTKLFRKRATAFEWPMTFRVDPDAPSGISDSPVGSIDHQKARD